MAISTLQQAEKSYKKLIGVSMTGLGGKFYALENPAFLEMYSDKVLIDSLPDTVSVASDGDLIDKDGNVTVDATEAVLQYHADVLCDEVPGADNSFRLQHSSIIPFNVKDGIFSPTLKDESLNTIPFGLNSWEIDSSDGTLTFFDGRPSGLSDVYATYYTYIGKRLSDLLLDLDQYVTQDQMETYVGDEIALQPYLWTGINVPTNDIGKDGDHYNRHKVVIGGALGNSNTFTNPDCVKFGNGEEIYAFVNTNDGTLCYSDDDGVSWTLAENLYTPIVGLTNNFSSMSVGSDSTAVFVNTNQYFWYNNGSLVQSTISAGITDIDGKGLLCFDTDNVYNRMYDPLGTFDGYSLYVGDKDDVSTDLMSYVDATAVYVFGISATAFCAINEDGTIKRYDTDTGTVISSVTSSLTIPSATYLTNKIEGYGYDSDLEILYFKIQDNILKVDFNKSLSNIYTTPSTGVEDWEIVLTEKNEIVIHSASNILYYSEDGGANFATNDFSLGLSPDNMYYPLSKRSGFYVFASATDKCLYTSTLDQGFEFNINLGFTQVYSKYSGVWSLLIGVSGDSESGGGTTPDSSTFNLSSETVYPNVTYNALTSTFTILHNIGLTSVDVNITYNNAIVQPESIVFVSNSVTTIKMYPAPLDSDNCIAYIKRH